MGRKTILYMAIACAAPSPHACVSSRSVSSPQANGVVDASAFLRRAYHSCGSTGRLCSWPLLTVKAAILDRRLYIDGGEFSFSKGGGISYESCMESRVLPITQPHI